MIRIDFHIHTVPAQHEDQFEFDIGTLCSYVEERNLDAIAITNHNLFDLEQFRTIELTVDCRVFAGIELDVEGGQLLMIDCKGDPSDFSASCDRLTAIAPSKGNPISVEQLTEIFGNLDDYILIPHYDKKPQLSPDAISKLKDFISAGEVSSPKKFVYCLKDESRLVPVLFSDCRISAERSRFPFRQTYLVCGEPTHESIKTCLRDKSKVALSIEEGSRLFQVFDDGQEICTGLNVLIGARSSGKTHTLKRIADAFENVRHIKQFSLVQSDEEANERKFEALLEQSYSVTSKDYLAELQDVVIDMLDVDLEADQRALEDYLSSLLKHAQESERHDTFSSATLYREEQFQILEQDNLKDLIASTENLIENIEFRPIIEKHVDRAALKRLIIALMTEYQKREEDRAKKTWINDLVSDVKNKLQFRSATTRIEEFDLYRYSLNRVKAARFVEVVNKIRRKRTIARRSVQGFTVVAYTKNFEGAMELRKLCGRQIAFGDAFKLYGRPYEYLQELKGIHGLEAVEYHKYLVRIKFETLNKDGYPISGGERSEFNLLQEIQNARKYDMLLIDEPESSFDNIFLLDQVNNLIKEISTEMPVVLVTHNNTVGASIQPDYLVLTVKEYDKEDVNYRLYSGFPSATLLTDVNGRSVKTHDVMLGCLEAGADAYNERRITYENIEN